MTMTCLLAAVPPDTGNLPPSAYIIIGIVAAGVMIGAFVAGVINKKKKK